MPNITLDEMKSLLNDQKNDILREMHSKFAEFKMDIQKTTEIAVKAETLANDNLHIFTNFAFS